MASRIDAFEYNGTRCFEMNNNSNEWDSSIIRFTKNSELIEPIIAKGNIFDGVPAFY